MYFPLKIIFKECLRLSVTLRWVPVLTPVNLSCRPHDKWTKRRQDHYWKVKQWEWPKGKFEQMVSVMRPVKSKFYKMFCCNKKKDEEILLWNVMENIRGKPWQRPLLSNLELQSSPSGKNDLEDLQYFLHYVVLGLALTSAGIRSAPSITALIIMQNLKDVGIIKLSYNQGHMKSIKCIPRDTTV